MLFIYFQKFVYEIEHHVSNRFRKVLSPNVTDDIAHVIVLLLKEPSVTNQVYHVPGTVDVLLENQSQKLHVVKFHVNVLLENNCHTLHRFIMEFA